MLVTITLRRSFAMYEARAGHGPRYLDPDPNRAAVLAAGHALGIPPAEVLPAAAVKAYRRTPDRPTGRRLDVLA